MDIKILESSKEFVDLEIGSVTIAEILRVYLNKDSSVEFVAWKHEHPTKHPVLRVETKGKNAGKAVKDAIVAIEKDLDSVLSDFSKLK
jgi:DNA-directed RNA polymerase subunit L